MRRGVYMYSVAHYTSRGESRITRSDLWSLVFNFLVRHAESCYPSLQTGSCHLSYTAWCLFFSSESSILSLVVNLGFSS
jgi:hypothetical protein